VIDDASSDATCDIVSEFRDPRFRLLRQSHQGAAAARNHGLEKSRGEIIQFLDADDLLSQNKIQSQVDALSVASGRSISCCGWAHFEDSVERSKPFPEAVWFISDPVEWLVKSLQGGGMMQPGCWLTPRVMLDAAGSWDTSLSLHDDGDYFARVLLEANQIVFVDDALVYYRTVRGSLSRQRSRHDIESGLQVCRARHAALLQRRDDCESRKAIATQYAQFAYEFARTAPDLAAEALSTIVHLGAEPAPTVGGKHFRRLASWLGFSAALRLRSLLR
jgi:glycosyltransferase involved in cell wall biosynthesis